MPFRIAISSGDPAGIGPEVIVKSFLSLKLPKDAIFIIFGTQRIFMKLQEIVGVIHDFRIIKNGSIPDEAGVYLFDCNVCNQITEVSVDSARASLVYLEKAIEFILAHKIHALVTAPVSKLLITKAGFDFKGHTEYLAEKTSVKNPVMMFADDNIKVSLATTHIAIRDLVSFITRERIYQVISVTNDAMRRFFDRENPSIIVSGLNPHAGEEGLFGREEIDVIRPAIEDAISKGINCHGPLSADSILKKLLKKEFDVAVFMYHDQVLPAIKSICKASTNITLGLPFVRTSPDHGTAFDIAGRYIADESPMINAINMAYKLLSKNAL
jgi:4-hydroxythreonine-4-phosphate dehydrogenase